VSNVAPGKIIALDAHDLSTVVWSYDTPGFVSNALTVIGTTLIAGDSTGTVYVFDTAATLANPAEPEPTATWSLPGVLGSSAGSDLWSVSEAIALDGSYVMTVWDLNAATAYLATLQAATPIPGSLNLVPVYAGLSQGLSAGFLGVRLLAGPPVVQQRTADGAATLAINAIATVLQVRAADGSIAQSFPVPNTEVDEPCYVQGELSLDPDNNQLWFGDGDNRLYCLDPQFCRGERDAGLGGLQHW